VEYGLFSDKPTEGRLHGWKNLLPFRSATNVEWQTSFLAMALALYPANVLMILGSTSKSSELACNFQICNGSSHRDLRLLFSDSHENRNGT
jgi:hypothetical protein